MLALCWMARKQIFDLRIRSESKLLQKRQRRLKTGKSCSAHDPGEFFFPSGPGVVRSLLFDRPSCDWRSNRNSAGMNELNNECRKEMAVPPVSKRWAKRKWLFRPFPKCEVFFFGVRRKNAQRSQDNVEQFVRKANIEQWATVIFFSFRSWGCPVPGCLTNHLQKQKIVSSKLPLCLMARQQIFDLRIRRANQNWSEMQNQVTNQSRSNS